MKTVKKIFVITVIAALNLFSITTCAEAQQSSTVEYPYLGSTLNISGEQVWEHTNSHTISGAYVKSTVNSGVNIDNFAKDRISAGNIKNGILSFSVIDPGTLIEWDNLIKIFYEWNNVTIDDNTVKSNVITLVTDTGGKLEKEKLYGTNTQLDLESVIYIYVDKDCKITGEYSEGTESGIRYWYTANILDLSFKKGWNMLCRREFLDNSGKDAVSMEIKQLVDFRWAIWP